MNPKNSKKSPIHENADTNITCDFGDGDISRSRSFLSDTYRRKQKRDRRRRPTQGQKTDSHVDFLNLIVDMYKNKGSMTAILDSTMCLDPKNHVSIIFYELRCE